MFMLVKGLEKRSFASPRKGAIQAIFVSVAIVLSAVPALALIDPWINEVDYDQPGTDTNEWIELAGPAGVSLDDFEILLINQVGSVYNTVDLADAEYTFSNEVNGVGFFMLGIVSPVFGAIADFTPAGWDSNEIQNGPTDSIQLRRKGGANVHLIDYDGQNTNTLENQSTEFTDSNTAPATTIYLTGTGTGFADFIWNNQANSGKPGTANLFQIIPPADVLLSNLGTSPMVPLEFEPVTVRVDASLINCAGNLVVTTLYRIGSSGQFQSLQMSTTSGDTYETSFPIPGQSGGTRVEYYVSASFSGGGTNSPAASPEGAPTTAASYTVLQTASGEVWVNEFNYNGAAFDINPEINEYIEIVGPSGTDLGDWSIELVDDTSTIYATYPFDPAYILPEDNTNGYGFFVLGDAGVPNINAVFTNELQGAPNTSMGKRGAIRLVDDTGQIIDEISYGFPPPTLIFPDAVYAGEDSLFALEDESLGLTGTGNHPTEFVWDVNTTLTPGADNQSQTFTPPPFGIPTLQIISIVQTGNIVTITSIGLPESWTVVPEYTTNPAGGESAWQMVSVAGTTFENGTNTTVFASPLPGSDSALYRLRASATP